MTQAVKKNIHFDSDPVHERLLALREKVLGLDQRAFAKLIGRSQSVLSKWERGDYRPSALVLMKIGDLSGDDQLWWYRQAGPQFAARLEAEIASRELPSRSTEPAPLDRDLLIYVMEALDIELKKRGKPLSPRKHAELVALFYEYCQETGKRDSSIVARMVRIA